MTYWVDLTLFASSSLLHMDKLSLSLKFPYNCYGTAHSGGSDLRFLIAVNNTMIRSLIPAQAVMTSSISLKPGIIGYICFHSLLTLLESYQSRNEHPTYIKDVKCVVMLSSACFNFSIYLSTLASTKWREHIRAWVFAFVAKFYLTSKNKYR